MSHWAPVFPGVWMFPDSCNVYAVEGKNHTIIINAGTGAWLECLVELPFTPGALLCTHYFRDHSAVAIRARKYGIPVHVPEGERDMYEAPEAHFNVRETYKIYDNLWNLFAPIEGCTVAGVLRNYDTPIFCRFDLEIIPIPGATIDHTGFACKTGPNDKWIIFCGEATHSPGKVPRVALYQYNYNDFGGGISNYYSLDQIQKGGFDALFPSKGLPISHNVASALRKTKANLAEIIHAQYPDPGQNWRDATELLQGIDRPTLEKASEHVWYSKHGFCFTWYIRSETGKVLSIDFGFNVLAHFGPQHSIPVNRRALLHDLTALQDEFGTNQINTVLVSHFHDDHVSGIPVSQRLQNTNCWATNEIADLIENPDAHSFPCNWPVSICVDRRFDIGDVIKWEKYEFHFHPTNGHTRFAALIGFEADGMKFARTGDQYFFAGLDGNSFKDRTRIQNHIYRNGAMLDGFEQSGDWLTKIRPDVVLSGHRPPMFTNNDFFDHLGAWNEEYRGLHQRAMPLEDSDIHFDLDSWVGWLWPYRNYIDKPGAVTIKATLRNPLSKKAILCVRLVGPHGWRSVPKSISAKAHQEVACGLEIFVDRICQRQAIAVEMIVDGQPFGQVAEALVPIGGDQF